MRALFIIFLTINCLCINTQELFAISVKGLVGKEYADCYKELSELYDSVANMDPASAYNVIFDLKAEAKKQKAKEWMLEAEMLDAIYHIDKILHQEQPVGSLLDNLRDIADRAEAMNATYIQLRALSKIMNVYKNNIKNYELSFEYSKLIDKLLNQVSVDEVPNKMVYHLIIGHMHYLFKDYDVAATYLQKVIDYPEKYEGRLTFASARNGLGLCWRYAYNDIEMSNQYFYDIINSEVLKEDPDGHELWSAIAKGNIAANMIIQGNYRGAIPLLEYTLEKTVKHNRHDYAVDPAINYADLYLKIGEWTNARKYLNLAEKYIDISGRKELLRLLYPLLSKYYAMMGNPRLAVEYMDSTINERDKYNKEFSGLQLLRAEQRANAYEQKAKDEELQKEKIRNTGYRRNLVIISIGLILVILLLIRYRMLYRKKQDAYQELVRKSQEWANDNGEERNKDEDIKNEDINTQVADHLYLLKQLETLVKEEKLYLDPDLTLDSIATKLQINRVYLSKAINSTGKNFSTFINELRIKEAVKILSDDSSRNLSIDQIAFDTGFNDRSSFYRVFKKIIGLSPTDFRKTTGKN
jgi:AraC-like DNA-binding protein